MRKGFTLIELLIVVAIIAILAAIAVPNFLEAQTRSKISRVKADQRSLATTMESFYVDKNAYPPCGFWQQVGPGAMVWVDSKFGEMPGPDANLWIINDVFYLTTPIAYITKIPLDPFVSPNPGAWLQGRMIYVNYENRRKYHKANGLAWHDPPLTIGSVVEPSWTISSSGPDVRRNMDQIYTDGILPPGNESEFLEYDATNGTMSLGDLFRSGPQ